ncbi:MAG TPA: hypothetical protein DCG12_04180 [Planctomycetaceae bacterium]|nr:hypothetical protein [Planctomycetaceae bacterium]
MTPECGGMLMIRSTGILISETAAENRPWPKPCNVAQSSSDHCVLATKQQHSGAFSLTNPSVYSLFATSYRTDQRENRFPGGSVSSGVARQESAPCGA